MTAEKRKSKSDVDMGGLGKAFRFTRDDLEANRAVYMSRAQQFQVYGITRQLFGWIVHSGLVSRLFRAPRPIERITSRVQKFHDTPMVVRSTGGPSDVKSEYHERINIYRIEIEMPNQAKKIFTLTETQYHAIPGTAELTFYYDPIDEQILSVESPYHASNQELGE